MVAITALQKIAKSGYVLPEIFPLPDPTVVAQSIFEVVLSVKARVNTGHTYRDRSSSSNIRRWRHIDL